MATETAMGRHHRAWQARRAPHLDEGSVKRVERFWAAVGLGRDDATDARLAHGVAYMVERWTGAPGRAAWVGRALFEFLRSDPTLAAWLDANAALTADDAGADALTRISLLEAERTERKRRLQTWDASLHFSEVEPALREWARCLLSPRTVSMAVSRSRRVLANFDASTDGQTIWLPVSVNSATGSLESRRIYLGLLAHEAAHIRADSFALDRPSPAADALWRRLASRVGIYGKRGGRRSGPEVGGVERFARCFSTERLAEFVLRLFEDARVDAWVRRHWQPLWPLLLGVRWQSRRDQPAPPVVRPREALLHALTEDALGLSAHYRVPAAWLAVRTEVARIASRLRDAANATAIDAASAAADALDVLQRLVSVADLERLDRAAGRALDTMPAVPAPVVRIDAPKKVPEIYASESGGDLDVDFGPSDGLDLLAPDAIYDEVDVFRGERVRAAVTCVPLREAGERHPDSGRMDLPPAEALTTSLRRARTPGGLAASGHVLDLIATFGVMAALRTGRAVAPSVFRAPGDGPRGRLTVLLDGSASMDTRRADGVAPIVLATTWLVSRIPALLELGVDVEVWRGCDAGRNPVTYDVVYASGSLEDLGVLEHCRGVQAGGFRIGALLRHAAARCGDDARVLVLTDASAHYLRPGADGVFVESTCESCASCRVSGDCSMEPVAGSCVVQEVEGRRVAFFMPLRFELADIADALAGSRRAHVLFLEKHRHAEVVAAALPREAWSEMKGAAEFGRLDEVLAALLNTN
jgi:hypothetical protein